MNDSENIKIVVFIRMARAALGITQLELAEWLGVSKITLARVETLESPLKAEVYIRAINIFKQHGVSIDMQPSDPVTISVGQRCLDESLAKLKNNNNRRSDRRPKQEINVIEDVAVVQKK